MSEFFFFFFFPIEGGTVNDRGGSQVVADVGDLLLLWLVVKFKLTAVFLLHTYVGILLCLPASLLPLSVFSDSDSLRLLSPHCQPVGCFFLTHP